jgi:hypothetical protein
MMSFEFLDPSCHKNSKPTVSLNGTNSLFCKRAKSIGLSKVDVHIRSPLLSDKFNPVGYLRQRRQVFLQKGRLLTARV